ncbi:MAG: hypothetical protein ACE5F9_14360, partial [Phycisphaerae bacterium]
MMRPKLTILAAMGFGLLAGTRPAWTQSMVPPMPDPGGEKGTSLISRLLQRLSGLAGIIEGGEKGTSLIVGGEKGTSLISRLLQRLSG